MYRVYRERFIGRGFALIIILGLASCTVANRSPHTHDLNLKRQVHDSIEKAVKFLCDSQTAQGCWRFRIERTGDEKADELLCAGRGPGVTSLVLYALTLTSPDALERYKDNIESAISYLLMTIDDGAVGARSNIERAYDWPNYTTALTLLAFLNYQPREIISISRDKPDRWKEYMPKMITYLKNAQHDEDYELKPADDRYGGWGLHGIPRRLKEDPGVSNISATVYVLEALKKVAKVSETDDVFKKALIYIKRCQNLSIDATSTNPHEDGGFKYTPTFSKGHPIEYEDPNGPTRRYYPSYGSATCDGLISLIDCGVSKDNARFQSAFKWIKKNFRADINPGFHPGYTFGQSFYYYYLCSLAILIDKLEKDEKIIQWPNEVAKKLIELQNSDGSWVNPITGMAEDNPFIATGFALITLNKLYPWIK